MEFPILAKFTDKTSMYNGKIIVLFVDNCSGIVLINESDNSRYRVGTFSTKWRKLSGKYWEVLTGLNNLVSLL